MSLTRLSAVTTVLLFAGCAQDTIISNTAKCVDDAFGIRPDAKLHITVPKGHEAIVWGVKGNGTIHDDTTTYYSDGPVSLGYAKNPNNAEDAVCLSAEDAAGVFLDKLDLHEKELITIVSQAAPGASAGTMKIDVTKNSIDATAQ